MISRSKSQRPVAEPTLGPMLEELKGEVNQAEEDNSQISGVMKVLTSTTIRVKGSCGIENNRW